MRRFVTVRIKLSVKLNARQRLVVPGMLDPFLLHALLKPALRNARSQLRRSA